MSCWLFIWLKRRERCACPLFIFFLLSVFCLALILSSRLSYSRTRQLNVKCSARPGSVVAWPEVQWVQQVTSCRLCRDRLCSFRGDRFWLWVIWHLEASRREADCLLQSLSQQTVPSRLWCTSVSSILLTCRQWCLSSAESSCAPLHAWNI